MPAPSIEKTILPGALGPILVDVRRPDSPGPWPAVIVLPGFKGFKDWGMFPPFAQQLAGAGLAAVSLNVSGSGVDDAGNFVWPDRFGHNTFSREQDDLDRVLAALDGGALGIPRPANVGILGHSRGGGMAVLFADRRPRLGALVTWASISHVRRWPAETVAAWRRDGRIDVTNARTGQVLPMFTDVLDDSEAYADSTLDVAAAAGRLTQPWLLIHGTADEAVPLAEADQLAAVAAGRDAFERLTLASAGHTFGAVHPYAGPTPALQEVFGASIRFLGRHLGGGLT